MISSQPIFSRMTLCDPGARAPVVIIQNAKLFSVGGANSRHAWIEPCLPPSGGSIYSRAIKGVTSCGVCLPKAPGEQLAEGVSTISD